VRGVLLLLTKAKRNITVKINTMETNEMHYNLLQLGFQVQLKRIGGYWVPFLIDLSIENQEPVDDPTDLGKALGIDDGAFWTHSDYWTDYFTVYNLAVESAYKKLIR
jgi:hypothetical protein